MKAKSFVYFFISIVLLVVSAGCNANISSTKNMILVPAGEFTMGGKASDGMAACVKFNLSCVPDWFKNEEPIHQVYLDAFWIDQTEVTNGMYAKCVQNGTCQPPISVKSFTRANYYGNPQFDNYPVVFISWQDAKTYCSWVGHRLPTEAEWEKAARGVDARAYPWGNDYPNTDLLNYKHAFEDTTQVGQFPKGASPYGVLDMAGNVWEWTADWYSKSYYAVSPKSNPLGPEKGELRVLRGGAFGSQVHNVRSTYRFNSSPEASYAWVGFRCARDE